MALGCNFILKNIAACFKELRVKHLMNISAVAVVAAAAAVAFAIFSIKSSLIAPN